MANEKRTENRVPTLVGVSSSDLTTPELLSVDPATNRLLVSAVVTSGGGSGTEYTEGDTDTTFTGAIALAEGPSDTATPLQVDASKHLQIDIAASSATVTVDGSGVTQPVSNAGLTELAAAINASSQVDVNIAANGIGLATSAKQDTIIGHVDGIEGLLTTIDADTGNIATSVASIDAKDLMLGTDFSSVFGTSSLIIATQADDVANTADGLQVTNFNMVFDGTTWDRLRGDSTNGALVNLGSNNDVTVTGTVDLGATDNAVLDAIASSVAAIDTDATTIIGHVDGIEGLLTTIDTDTGNIATNTSNAATSLAILDDWDNAASDGASVSGDTVHDNPDAGEPVKIGFKAETSPKGITLVADGDRTDGYADADGLQMVKLNTSFADVISERVTDTGGSSTAFTNFSAVASTKNYVTAITVYNSSATAGYVDFRDGTGGSVLWTVPLPAGGGAVLSGPGPYFKTSANTALAYDVSAALSTVYISVSGFQSKV